MPQPRQRSGAIDDLERRLAQETEAAQRQREAALREVERRETKRRKAAIDRRRRLRYVALWLSLVLTAVLVTLVMFRVLTLVFA
ncbi:MAG: ubiquitin carboxyl-hydrolase [Solirubrobacteraceae bacterium]